MWISFSEKQGRWELPEVVEFKVILMANELEWLGVGGSG